MKFVKENLVVSKGVIYGLHWLIQQASFIYIANSIKVDIDNGQMYNFERQFKRLMNHSFAYKIQNFHTEYFICNPMH